MSKLKKVLLMGTAYALVVALAVGLTVAYLQHDDSDVNVMTLGNVKIEQLEYERVMDGNGNWVSTGEADQYGYTPDKLQTFTQDKPAYPAVYQDGDVKWDDRNGNQNSSGAGSHQQSWAQVGAPGSNQLFDDSVKNVVDKFVFVKNTGKTNAYYRTYIAIEWPKDMDQSLLHTNMNANSRFTKTNLGFVEYGGTDYLVYEMLYNEILKPGEVSRPSFLQVFLDPAATNEDCERLGDEWKIYAVSQAVQSAGFENAGNALTRTAVNAADAALDTAFGEPMATNSEANRENVAVWLWNVDHDTWDGTADISWYDPANPQTAYEISTAEQLAGLSELVSGNTTFAGVTFTLTNNVDLYCEDTTPSADGDPLTFRPIGDHAKNGTFEGTFDGNGKTISNLYQNGWDLGYQWGIYGSYGLFGNLNDATVKNLTLSGSESYIEGGDVSFVAGSATGTCIFENITIEDSVAATYNNGCGGIIGWSGAGDYTFKNITIAKDCVLAGLWGSFDSSIGGIVGQGEPGATYNFENVDIACRIDAYNDCTASYDYYNYRMCGMLIGRLEETTTIDGKNYPDTSKYNITCNNVTVTYGDWMNYHYCEPTPGLNGGRGMRVEPGYAYDGLPADYDHSQCIDNHMNLIPFDQIFGGDQIGVKGLKTYDGVTVNYPASYNPEG